MLRVAEIVSTFQADLVGLGEYEQSQAGALHTRLQEQYPYHALYPASSDVALFSRYPIVARRLIRSPELRSPFLRAEVDVEGTLVTVYVVHLVSPTFNGLPWRYDDSARDREVAAILPRSILLGGSCRATAAMLGTLEPIVVRMTEGRVVRMWQYDGRWYCSFLPWKSVRFATEEQEGPRAGPSVAEAREGLVPALHQDPEGDGNVQRPLGARERDAHPSEG